MDIILACILLCKLFLVYAAGTSVQPDYFCYADCYRYNKISCDCRGNAFCRVFDEFGHVNLNFDSDLQQLLVFCPKNTDIELLLHNLCDPTPYLSKALKSKMYKRVMNSKISLKLNKLTVIYNRDFAAEPIKPLAIQEVRHLQFIITSREGIITVPNGMFDRYNNVETLTLSVQRLTSKSISFRNLTKAYFQHLTALRQLDLAGNNMKMLDADIFATLTQLNCLNLSRNAIRELPANILVNQSKLLILDLSHNLLTYLTPQIFDQTPLLWELKLVGNYLHDTINLMENLKPLHYLYRLDLSQNQLQTNWSTETSVKTIPALLRNFRYSNMSKLWALDDGLSYIRKLQEEKYEDSKLSSTIINLSGNLFREFDMDWLVAAGIRCPLELNLEYNSIKNIYASMNLSSTTTDCALKIKMAGNPVVSDCTLVWIYSDNYRSLFDDLECDQTSTKIIKDLTQLEAWKPVMCPSKCNCYTQSEFFHINCNGAQLDVIEQLPRPEQFGRKSSILNITGNNFSVLPLNTTFGYANVSEL